MYSTQNNIVTKLPTHEPGKICRKNIRYPDVTGQRRAEGGLRCSDQFKKSLPGIPLITVITVVYNDAASLAKTIQSVLKQKYDNMEYIIIDGGSVDGTLNIIKKYENYIDYFISEPDAGIYDAMNKGLSLAQGDLVGLLNSGDWYEPEALSVIAQNGAQFPGSIIAATQRTYDERFNEIMTRGLRFDDERVYLRMPVSHPGSFIPSEVYESVGAYNGKEFPVTADWDFIIRCFEQKVEFESVSDIVVNYWRVGVSAKGSNAIWNEQIKLLHSRFPSIQNHNLLFLLSSQMDEKNARCVMVALRKHLNTGGCVPEKILKAVYLYHFQNHFPDFDEWVLHLHPELKLDSTGDYCVIRKNHVIYKMISKGIEEKLHEKEIWLISDRGWDAQDNGFVFYAWLKEYHPEINAYFVITKDSPDYDKVVALDPETVLEYESRRHQKYYIFSKFVISSQGGKHCHPLNYDYLKAYHPTIFKSRYVFLQHGVSKDYIDYFHKGRFNNSLFAITGDMEKCLFERDYQYTELDLMQTGFCRFDLLHKSVRDGASSDEPFVFFMPTWRTWINDEETFLASEYYQLFNDILHSASIARLMENSGMKFKIFIHPNFSQYSKYLVSHFETVEVLNESVDISALIRDCTVMITDYSSAVLDAAFMDKPIIYLQPDYERFRATHYNESPAFSYKNHGLGPVVSNVASLEAVLTNMTRSDFVNSDKYRERANYIFTHKDNQGCQRTFGAISNYFKVSDLVTNIYLTEHLVDMGPLKVCVKDENLYVFNATADSDNIIIHEFTIIYHRITGEQKSQAVNLFRSAMVCETERGVVYAFYTRVPKLTKEIEIFQDLYPIEDIAIGEFKSKKMKVAQLGFTIRGGAGIAAVRLNTGLCAKGVDSIILQKEEVQAFAPYGVYTFNSQMNDVASSWLNNHNCYRGNTFFSVSAPSEHCTHEFLQRFDILNLHWTAKYLSTETIAHLSHCDTPVVWTFHDINPLSGGCHYFHGCTQWKTDCTNCPQLKDTFDDFPAKVLAAKKRYFNFGNITVVVLNNHFKKLVQQSPLFNGSRIEVIPNSIDTDKYCPQDRTVIRKKLDLDLDKFYILYVAAYASTIKGYKEFEETIRILSDMPIASNTEILLAGALPSNRNFPLPYVDVGHVSEEELIDLYSAADATVVSSIEDNHPNVMLESISCGTPIVGFEVGGIPDVVTNGYNGYYVDNRDCDALANSIVKVLTGPDLSKNCRAYAEKYLRLEVQAERYKKLYNELSISGPRKSAMQATVPELFPETAFPFVQMHEKALSWQISRSTTLHQQLAMSSDLSTRLDAKIPAKYHNKCFRDGWSHGESWGRWTDGMKAVTEICLRDYESGPLTAVFAIRYKRVTRQDIEVFVNGVKTTFVFDSDHLFFPLIVRDDKTATVEFAFNDLQSPFELGSADEKRILGIGVEWFQIKNVPFVTPAERVKKELAYRVGHTFIDSFKSIGGFFAFPWSLVSEVGAYSKDYNSPAWQSLPSPDDYSNTEDIERVQNHLSYRVGKLVLDAWESKYKMSILPFRLVIENLRFSREARQKKRSLVSSVETDYR